MGTQQHILIADAGREARLALARDLNDAGYAVSQADSAAEATAIVLGGAAEPDLLILQTDPTDPCAVEAVARLRRRGVSLPIFLLADAATEDDVVHGLDTGADDFMVRPFGIRELVARLRVHLRARSSVEESEVRIGPTLFRPALRTMTHPDLPRPLKLTEKETALLLRLVRSNGQPVSRQTLLSEVWGYSPDATSHTVETHIYRLRRKIEPTPQSPPLLISEAGGYRLLIDELVGVPAMAGDMRAPSWSRPALPRPPPVSVAVYRVG